MSHVYTYYESLKMLQNLGLKKKQSEEVLRHFGGIYEVGRILNKYGDGTISYLPTIVKYFKEVPVTFPDHATLGDGKSYFLLLFSVLY